MGTLLSYLGRPDEGVAWLDDARRIDRFHPPWHWRHLGFVLYFARRYEDAIAAFGRSPEKPYWVHAYLAACHAQVGRRSLARDAAEAVLRAKPDFSLATFATKEPFRNAPDLAHKLDGLRRAELPE